jgi:hypothetical protein
VFDLPAAGTWSIAVERVSGIGTYQLTRTIFGGPAPVCGNDTRDFNETCDGTDAQFCPGLCKPDCTCPTPVCGNDVAEQGEQCDGVDAAGCPGQCTAACECPLTCTQDDLVNISARITAQRFRLRGRLLTFGGAFDGVDPRQGFAITLTQGGKTVTVDIPADDAGWAASNPARGNYKWKGSLNGITRVTANDRSARSNMWKVVVGGTAVPGAGVIDVSQPVNVQLTIDHACTRTIF